MDRMAVCKRGPLCISDHWGGVEPLKQAADRCPIVARRSLQEPPPFRAGEFQWYTGSGDYSAGETSGGITILQGVLAGGPSYRGYEGSGYPDDVTEISYVYHWIDENGEHSETLTEYAWQFLDTNEAVQYHGAYYPVEGDGSFSASGSYTDEEGATYTWAWNLTSP